MKSIGLPEPIKTQASREIVMGLERLLERVQSLAERTEDKLAPIACQLPECEELCGTRRIYPLLFDEMDTLIGKVNKALTRINNVVDAAEV